jgi:hypothetical protein
MEGSTTKRTHAHSGHELKAALSPGLVPDVQDWAGVQDLSAEHEAVLQAVVEAFEAGKALRDQYQREDSTGRLATDYAERQALLHEARIAEQAARQEAEVAVTRLVAEAREHLPEWREVEAAVERERRAEIAELRARLSELEVEDGTAKRLHVWLDRLDPERITPGLIPWSAMAAIPVPPDAITGPMQKAFAPRDLQEDDAA